MLSVLVESGVGRGGVRRAVPSTLVSVFLHGGLLAGAVVLTLPPPPGAAPTTRPVVPLTLPPRDPAPVPQAPEDPGPLTFGAPGGDVPLPDFTVPDGIPPIDLDVPPIPVRALGPGREIPWGVPWGSPDVGPKVVFTTAGVDLAPRLLSAPPVRYPSLLEHAGVEGEVVLEVVIGTDGRPEAETLRVIASSRPEFVAPASDVVLGALFEAGRVHGSAVRVVVRLPVVFRIARS